MNKIKWFKCDPTRWSQETRRMTLAERGAFFAVMMFIMSADGKVADDDDEMALDLRCNVEMWRVLKAKLISLGCLYVKDGFLRNYECDKLAAEALRAMDDCDSDSSIAAEIRAVATRLNLSDEQLQSFYMSEEWRALRREVFKRYDRVCMACGARSDAPMHVDHILPRSLYPHLELDIDNLQVLCEPCNRSKSNRHATDYRQ